MPEASCFLIVILLWVFLLWGVCFVKLGERSLLKCKQISPIFLEVFHVIVVSHILHPRCRELRRSLGPASAGGRRGCRPTSRGMWWILDYRNLLVHSIWYPINSIILELICILNCLYPSVIVTLLKWVWFFWYDFISKIWVVKKQSNC